MAKTGRLYQRLHVFPKRTGSTADLQGICRAGLTQPVKLNIADPHFMASAYDTYADLRAKGPVSRVRFAGGEVEVSGDGEDSREFYFRSETFFVTHYDEVIATLLDHRFSVDPRRAW